MSWRQTWKKIFCPGPLWVILLVLVGGGMVFTTFYRGLEGSVFAYVSYVLSAYGLVVACVFLAQNLKGNVKGVLHRNRYVHRYLTDISFKTHVSLYRSLVLNLVFAAIKLFYGIRYHSVWFGTLAIYYIMLSLTRFLLLHVVNKNGMGTEIAAEYRRYRMCGALLLLMSIVLVGVVILVVWENEGFHYPGYLIYVVAMYAFYNIIMAVWDMVRYRKQHGPVMTASKVIRLVTAMVSMLALETAMLAQFDEGKGPEFRRLMTGVTGGCVCLIVLVIAIVMIAKSTRWLEELRKTV